MAHPHASICVGMTGISFGDICRACMVKQSNLQMVMDGRLSLGFSDHEKDLDMIHATGFKEGREVSFLDAMSQLKATQDNLQEASAITRELARSAAESAAERRNTSNDLKTFKSSCENLRVSVRDLDNWRVTLNNRYEVLVTHLLRIHLERLGIVESLSDVREIPEQFKLVYAPKETTRLGQSVSALFDHGFEWDGVVYVPSMGHLYLVEAKSNLNASHIQTMKTRLERTVSFIQSKCSQAKEAADCFGKSKLEVPLTKKERTAVFDFVQLCNIWSQYQNVNSIFGVVGGIGFTKEMILAAKNEGYICIYPNAGGHRVDPPDCLVDFVPHAEKVHETRMESSIINDDTLRDEMAESAQTLM